MVYGIVKTHHGNIVCDSAPGEGTTFNIYFPVLEEDLKGAGVEKERQRTQGGHETIMIVDDEVELRMGLKDLFSHYGYRVLTAGSGEEALELYEEYSGNVDLVILVLIMPGMGGETMPGTDAEDQSGCKGRCCHRSHGGWVYKGIGGATRKRLFKEAL
jgi:hypothetical protein